MGIIVAFFFLRFYFRNIALISPVYLQLEQPLSFYSVIFVLFFTFVLILYNPKTMKENDLYHNWITLNCDIIGTDYLAFQTDREMGAFIRKFRSSCLGEVTGNKSFVKRAVRRVHGDCYVVASVVCTLLLIHTSLICLLFQFS